MFGQALRLELPERAKSGKVAGVDLLPLNLEQVQGMTPYFQSLRVNMYTGMNAARTKEDEETWYERVRKDEFSIHWGIFPHVNGSPSSTPVGVTGLHGLGYYNTCSSGIIIGDTSWWGKGVASLCHIVRTWYAHDVKRVRVIHTQVRWENDGSRKALLRVGYCITGVVLCDAFRDNTYLSNYTLVWHTPDDTEFSLLYPTGRPSQVSPSVWNQIVMARKRAQIALEIGRNAIVKL